MLTEQNITSTDNQKLTAAEEQILLDITAKNNKILVDTMMAVMTPASCKYVVGAFYNYASDWLNLEQEKLDSLPDADEFIKNTIQSLTVQFDNKFMENVYMDILLYRTMLSMEVIDFDDWFSPNNAV
jgi:hypothetical protein